MHIAAVYFYLCHVKMSLSHKVTFVNLLAGWSDYLGVRRGCQTLRGAAGPTAGGTRLQARVRLQAAKTDGDLVDAGTYNHRGGREYEVPGREIVFSKHFSS